jgi:hypothetical protein
MVWNLEEYQLRTTGPRQTARARAHCVYRAPAELLLPQPMVRKSNLTDRYGETAAEGCVTAKDS